MVELPAQCDKKRDRKHCGTIRGKTVRQNGRMEEWRNAAEAEAELAAYNASKAATTASMWASGVEAPAVTPTVSQPANQTGSSSSADST